VPTAAAATQSFERAAVALQTDGGVEASRDSGAAAAAAALLLEAADAPGLGRFLSSAALAMEAALAEAGGDARVFAEYLAHPGDDAVDSGDPRLLHTLVHAPALAPLAPPPPQQQQQQDQKPGISCTSIAWMAKGAVLAVAYGHLNHESGCTHKAHLAMVRFHQKASSSSSSSSSSSDVYCACGN
jgi:hypothetical protein